MSYKLWIVAGYDHEKLVGVYQHLRQTSTFWEILTNDKILKWGGAMPKFLRAQVVYVRKNDLKSNDGDDWYIDWWKNYPGVELTVIEEGQDYAI